MARGTVFGERFVIESALPTPGLRHTRTFKARDSVTGRTVALEATATVVPPGFQQDYMDPLLAWSSRLPEHPHVITLFGYGWDPRTQAGWCATDLVTMPSLGDVVKRDGPLAPERGLVLARQLLSGLEVFVRAGRFPTPTPGEILVEAGTSGSERVRLSLGRHWGETYPGFSIGVPSTWGSAAYEPREAGGFHAQPATCVYAAAACLYFMLTGRAPHSARTTIELAMATATTRPEPPSRWRPGLPAALDALVMEALEKDPARRPRDPRAYAARLSSAFCTWEAGIPAVRHLGRRF
ncbi:hypothetical protein HY251_05235 [bacterium]|nr:hypothetical protein [bacterium]